ERIVLDTERLFGRVSVDPDAPAAGPEPALIPMEPRAEHADRADEEVELHLTEGVPDVQLPLPLIEFRARDRLVPEAGDGVCDPGRRGGVGGDLRGEEQVEVVRRAGLREAVEERPCARRGEMASLQVEPETASERDRDSTPVQLEVEVEEAHHE